MDFKNYALLMATLLLLLSCSQPNATSDSNKGKSLRIEDSIAKHDTAAVTVVSILDTVINAKSICVNWFSNGKITFSLNNYSDTISWFPFDDFADKTNHAAIITPGASAAKEIVISKDNIFFSVVDFRGRAALFHVNTLQNGPVYFDTTSCSNPLINESSYIFVDLNKNKIINTGGLVDLSSDRHYIYFYEIINGSVKCSNVIKSDGIGKLKFKDLELSLFKDADTLYMSIK